MLPVPKRSEYKEVRQWLPLAKAYLSTYPRKARMMLFFHALGADLWYKMSEVGVTLEDDFESRYEDISRALMCTGRREQKFADVMRLRRGREESIDAFAKRAREGAQMASDRKRYPGDLLEEALKILIIDEARSSDIQQRLRARLEEPLEYIIEDIKQAEQSQHRWTPERPHPDPGPSTGNRPRRWDRRSDRQRIHAVVGELESIPTVYALNGFSCPYVSVKVGQKFWKFLIDTGASCSLVHPKVLPRKRRYPTVGASLEMQAVNGTTITATANIELSFVLGSKTFRHPVHVTDAIKECGILGADFLVERKVSLNLWGRVMSLGNMEVPIEDRLGAKEKINTVSKNKAAETRVNRLMGELGTIDDQMATLIRENADVFVLGEEPPGRCSIVQHIINSGTSPPIRQRPRRIPLHYQEEVNKVIRDMLDKKIIRPSSSPWASPIVVVKKKDGSIRLCVDYRKLNAVTSKDNFPLPRIDVTLDALGGSKLFSTLDLKSGYWQVEVEKESRAKTAFVMPTGLYEFETMPFGLANAPATFQRLMTKVLEDLIPNKCLVYMDDVIVHSKTLEEHRTHLKEVFDKLRRAGLTLNPKKCVFLKKSVTFLGHVVSGKGIQPDPSHTDKIQNWPTPVNVEELRSFLGLASYYRRFIKDFAHIAAPLHALTNKGKPWIWSPENEQAFKELKSRLIQAPILAFPDVSEGHAQFILDTDASNRAIGGVLSQRQEDGLEHPIAYGSKVLSKAERNYSTTKKEMFALKYFLEYYKHYLLGSEIIVRTDHQALKWLSSFKEPEGIVARWLETLSQFNMKVEYRKGLKHNNADALSRRPEVAHTVNALGFQEISFDEWAQLQRVDPDIQIVYERQLNGGQKPTGKEMAGCSLASRTLWSAWSQLKLIDGVLCYHFAENYPWRVVLPRSHVYEVIGKLHTSLGHVGIPKLEAAVRQRYWWPFLHDDIRAICSQCRTCGEAKSPNQRNRAPMQPIVAGFPNEIVGLDIVGPLPLTANGNRYILVMTDFFTKWANARPMKEIDAGTVAQEFIAGWVADHGVPYQIHTDRGTQFESSLLQELCKVLRIKKSRTTTYHPQGNGQVERTNRTLKQLLTLQLDSMEHDKWDTAIPACLLAYRAAEHASTGHTPAFLMYGRELRVPADVQYMPPRTWEWPEDKPYPHAIRERLWKAHMDARHKLHLAHKHQKDYYDKKSHGPSLVVGDKVWFMDTKLPGDSEKFNRPWQGPYEICKVLNEANVKIRLLGVEDSPAFVTHVNKLKPYLSHVDLFEYATPPPVDHEVEISSSRWGSTELREGGM